MLYFPAIWILSVLFYVLFFWKLRKNEKTYGISVEKYPYSEFPNLKKIKSIIKNSIDKDLKKDFKLQLLYLYLAYAMIFIPVIIYFILGVISS